MEIKNIYNRLGEGKSNKLFIDGATHYLANCIKENSGAKDTGLYYKPCGKTGNLSRIGKIYSSPNNILNQYGRKNYIFIRLLGENKNRIAEITGDKIYESSTEIQFEIPKSEFGIQYLE